MIKNLLDTGTPFDYKDVDFGRILNLLNHHNHKNDKQNAQMPPLDVGIDSNPDKNQMYVDKEGTFEDE